MLAKRLKVIASLGDDLQSAIDAEPGDRRLRPKHRAARTGAAVEENRARKIIQKLREGIDDIVVGHVRIRDRQVAEHKPMAKRGHFRHVIWQLIYRLAVRAVVHD